MLYDDGYCLFLSDEIDQDKTTEMKKDIMGILADSEENCKIYIFIDSSGGNLFSSLSLAEFIDGINIHDTDKKIKGLQVEINTVACGECSSGATMVFLSGKNRYAYPSTIFMEHQPRIVASEYDSIDAGQFIKMSDKIHDRFIEKTLQKTKLGKKEYDRLTVKEWWFDAYQAVEKGIATEVIDVKVDPGS
jgi:ATP-dependent protease ClpP protease subunit